MVAVAAARIPPASHISRVLLLILRWQYCSSATTEKPSLSKLLSITTPSTSIFCFYIHRVPLGSPKVGGISQKDFAKNILLFLDVFYVFPNKCPGLRLRHLGIASFLWVEIVLSVYWPVS